MKSNINIIDKKMELLEKIKKGDEVDYNFLSLNDLLMSDTMGKNYLEYASLNKDIFSPEIRNEIIKSFEAMCICIRNNNLDFLFFVDEINEDILFFRNDDNISIIEMLLEVKFNIYSFLKQIKCHCEIIDYLIEYGYDDYSLISDDIVRKLFLKKNGEYPIDKYISNEKLMSEIIGKVSLEVLINYCNDKSNYEILRYCHENYLLMRTDDNRLLIELLLDNDYFLTFGNKSFKNESTIKILMNYNRTDLLINADARLLLLSYDLKNLYFDLIIEKVKKGKKELLTLLFSKYFENNSYVNAQILLHMAKNDVIQYIPSLTSKMLLYRDKIDGKCVLELLIEEDRELTLSNILSICKDRYQSDIAIILRCLDIEPSFICFNYYNINYSKELIKQYCENYSLGIESKYEYLLEELKNLFYNDGMSDKDCIDKLISSYRYVMSLDDFYGVIELRRLIEIKKYYYDFVIYNSFRTCFADGEICLNNNAIGALNHEIGHALHYYLLNNYVPMEFFVIVKELKRDPLLISRVEEYTKRYNDLVEEVFANISDTEIAKYYASNYTEKNIFDLVSFLSLIKEDKREMFKFFYPKEVLDTILARTYSVDEFFSQRKKMEKWEVVDTILLTEYDAFVAIGDIIDAIFEGEYRNGLLVGSSGSLINATKGHGIAYYCDASNRFSEILANYGEIIKSKNGMMMLEYLRNIVGDNLVDFLDDFYFNKMLSTSIGKYVNDFGEGYKRKKLK